MVTVPDDNRILWSSLDALYASQLDTAQHIRKSLDRLLSANPEIARDPLARDALRAAMARQDGLIRYAESQIALAETMLSYWEQRSGEGAPAEDALPLVRRAAATMATPTTPRTAVAMNVAE